jgi:hypothetical protein
MSDMDFQMRLVIITLSPRRPDIPGTRLRVSAFSGHPRAKAHA